MRQLAWNGLVAIAALAAAGAFVACGSDDNGGGPGGNGGSGGSGGSGGGSGGGSSGSGAVSECEDACCPPDNGTCYLDGNPGPGAECLAHRDNSKTGPNPDRVQFRQTWIRTLKPVGNTIPIVYDVLRSGSELPQVECGFNSNTSRAAGFMQLIDLNLAGDDITQHTSRIGYSQLFLEDEVPSVIQQGACMIEDTYDNPAYRLPASAMSDSSDFPDGLAAPMPLPWTVKPVLAKRLATDFDLETDREDILADLAADPDHNGVFYLDEETGESHGYSPLTYSIVYTVNADTGEVTYIAVPIREAETHYQTNDPESRNCQGVFRGESMDPSAGCNTVDANDPENPPWGCVNDSCPGLGPNTTSGYFLITEIEQVFATALQSSLCVSYQGFDNALANDWFVEDGSRGDFSRACRSSPKWDPTAADDAGLPMGDWCAATNSAATPTCHDAFRNESYHVFAGFNVQDDTCTFE